MRFSRHCLRLSFAAARIERSKTKVLRTAKLTVQAIGDFEVAMTIYTAGRLLRGFALLSRAQRDDTFIDNSITFSSHILGSPSTECSRRVPPRRVPPRRKPYGLTVRRIFRRDRA